VKSAHQPVLELPTPHDFLGELFDPSWDYRWVMPSMAAQLCRRGWEYRGEMKFYYGSTLHLVGTLREVTD
jgi:hypothetical protein